MILKPKNSLFNLVNLFSLTLMVAYFSAASANTEALLQNQRFVDGTLNVRLKSPIQTGAPLLVAIPGGPGISGHYLDLITIALAEQLGINALVVDLPNHDQSGRSQANSPIKYAEVHDILMRFLTELSTSEAKIILLGHSLGAVIAADLLRSNQSNIERTILVSGPIDMNGSCDFDTYLKKIGASESTWQTEADFQSWWRKVIPGYFLRPPSGPELELLAGQTFWLKNEQFTEGMPSLAEVSSALSSSQIPLDIIYIEGEKELVLPSGNFEKVKATLPASSFEIIEKAGHFPMLEQPGAFIKAVTKHLNKCTSALLGKPQGVS